MGMSDEHIAQLKKLKSFHNGSYGANINFAIDTMRKYQKLQADYENRLKADLVAMLEDIQLEIEELDFFEGEEPVNITQELMDEVKSWGYGVKDCKKLIQQKINSLKEA